MSETEYRWTEQEMAQHLGVTMREVRRLKKEHLAEGQHYVSQDKATRLNDAAVASLCEALGVDLPEGMDLTKKTAPAANGDDPAMFVVLRLCPNPTWVLGCLVDAELQKPTEKCRVRNNAYLRFRQTIPVVKNGDHFIAARVRS